MTELSDIPSSSDVDKHPVLLALGERVRDLRKKQGLTRKALAQAARMSERHLASLEYGVGNVSVLVLHELALALKCPLALLLGDESTQSPEWLLIRDLLRGRNEQALKTAREQIEAALSSQTQRAHARAPRIALIGLRGAGKSTLGQMLAADLKMPFVELGRRIEDMTGSTVAEIQALYGAQAYRRYERRALQEIIDAQTKAVLAIPGGLVSEPQTYDMLLANCTCIWLQATPMDHMQRVRAQGDLRPMAASKEAMEDLKAILASRADSYAKAQFRLDTSAQPLHASFELLRQLVRSAIAV